MVPKRSRDSPSGDFVSQPRGGITCCNYAQSGAALTYETCSPRPNSTTYGLKFYRSVCDAIAYHFFERTSVTFNLTRNYGNFLFSYKLKVALTSFFIIKYTTNSPLRTGHENVEFCVKRSASNSSHCPPPAFSGISIRSWLAQLVGFSLFLLDAHMIRINFATLFIGLVSAVATVGSFIDMWVSVVCI